MASIRAYENYPVRTMILSNLVSLTVYLLGFLIILRLGLVFSLLFLGYVLALEYRLLRYHCPNCYYWGKNCAFGKGKLSSLFFKKGDPAKFCVREMTWKDMIPDMLLTLIPLIIGIVLLILHFDLIMLAAVLFLVLLTTSGNGYIRGTLACRYCKQRASGCPAAELFKMKT